MSIVDPLPAKIREILQKEVSRVKRLEIRHLVENKRNILLSIAISILIIGIFVYPMLKMEVVGFFSEKKAYAKEKDSKQTEISADAIDPLHKIGQGIMTKDGKISNSCVGEPDMKKDKEKAKNPAMSSMLAGFPMEEMIPALNSRNKEVAAYLVAIAKKESNWGKHTPKKDGQECYNYWGYRGKENTTASGYSCFDSPAHAVEVVGNRIEKLLDQNINTPAKMVVWKCGRDCEAAGGQAAADKWISDVAAYYNKLRS